MKTNKYIFHNDYIEILCPKGKEEEIFSVFIDKEDYNIVKKFFWRIHTVKGYACASCRKINEEGRKISTKIMLHNLIMGNKYKEGLVIDHLDRNKLNCRKINLVFKDFTGNNFNKSKDKRNSSGRTGVTLCKYSSGENKGEPSSWCGHYKKDGKNYRKWFSIKKYGYEQAFRLAEEFREKGEIEFNITTEK